MDYWTAPRPWKGKACTIKLFSEACAELFVGTAPAPGGEAPHFPEYSVICPTGEERITVNARVANIVTDPRLINDGADGPVLVRLMGEGVMAGLEERRDHLPGRFTVCKAIGLAVHLGASSITVLGDISPRAMRNLDTMRRPLKGHRVRLAINPEPA